MISRTERALNYIVLSAFTVVVLLPVGLLVLTALKSAAGPSPSFGFPTSLHIENFVAAWNQGHFGSYLKSSAIVAVSVVVVVTVVCTLAGYAFGAMRFPGNKALFYLLMLGIVVPYEILIISLYYDFRALSLTNTYWAMILPHIGLSVPFGTFWMRAFFLATPRSLVESARIDGGTSWTILWRVLAPLARPAILTMIALVFMWTWNDFLIALVMVSEDSLRTAPLGLGYFQGRYTEQTSLMAAAAILVATPVVVLYIFLQRHFIRGMLSGAIKG